MFRPGADCPAPLKSLARRFFDDQSRLTPEAFVHFHEFLHKASSNGHEFRCYDDALGFIAQVRDKAHLAERVAAAFPRGIRSKEFAKLLKTSLYPYQREGALFAAKAGRSLVADDMGLGKTIQAIAAVEILAQNAGVERVLVVSPTSLKHQWMQEIEKFTDRPALVVEGLLARRTELYAAPSFYKLTNYDVICRDLEAIRRWQPDVIILDEAQRIKNWKTRTAQTVKQLDSKYAIVLTGTPLENRLEELHSIVEFVDRFRLGPMFRFLDKHQHVDEGGRVVGYRNLSEISKTLEAILIRRTKDKVLQELPERMEKRFFVPMTKEQMSYHEENRETVARLVQKWRRYRFLAEADQLRMRIALQNMRMSCNSTYLLDKKTDHGVKADELADLLAEVFEDEQAKVVVFSQWVRMHELVVRRLERRKWEHVFFHGGVPGPERKGSDPPLQGRPGLPLVPGHRRRRRGPEPAKRLGRGESRSALEPGRVGAADRPGASPGPASPGPRGRFHRPRHDRGRDARAAGVQEVDVRRRVGRRAGRSFHGRHAAEEVHGVGREGHRLDPGLDAAAVGARAGRADRDGRGDARTPASFTCPESAGRTQLERPVDGRRIVPRKAQPNHRRRRIARGRRRPAGRPGRPRRRHRPVLPQAALARRRDHAEDCGFAERFHGRKMTRRRRAWWGRHSCLPCRGRSLADENVCPTVETRLSPTR